MAKRRQVILFAPSDGKPAGTLGTRPEILKVLADFNTAPDGSREGEGLAHGPGIVAQFPMTDPRDDVAQVLVAINDDDVAWAVLERLCVRTGWKLMDPENGQIIAGRDAGAR